MKTFNVTMVILFSAALVNSLSQILMRWGGRYSHNLPALNLREALWGSRWWVAGVVISWVSGLGWAWVVRSLPLASTVPLYTGLVYILTIAASIAFLQEGLHVRQAIGAGLILAGMLLVVLPK